jgi:hypothetical protein
MIGNVDNFGHKDQKPGRALRRDDCWAATRQQTVAWRAATSLIWFRRDTGSASLRYFPLGSQAFLTPPSRRATRWMTWLSRWPEILLAVLVVAFELYRSGNAATPIVAHAIWTEWTSQRKLEMRYAISSSYITTD